MFILIASDLFFFFFQAEDGIRDDLVTGVQTCALPISSLQSRIAGVRCVAETTSVLMDMQSIEDAPMMMVSGREWGGFTWEKLDLISGRLPRDGNERAVILGCMAAEVLKKKVGDTLQIEAEELPVVG